MSRRALAALAFWLAIAAAITGQAAGVAVTAGEPGRQVSGLETVQFTVEGLDRVVVAVRVGGSVRWVNADTNYHNTTHLPNAGEPSLWNSYAVAPGAVFTRTFELPGTYRYFDFFDPESVALQGVVVVTTGEIPPSPTARPTHTQGPSPTRPAPTATAEPTATLTPSPVAVVGRLAAYSAGTCQADAVILDCDTGFVSAVRAGFPLDAYFGYDVRIEAVATNCETSGDPLLLLTNLQALPAGCSAPTPTPPATSTPAPGENLARGAPVRASIEVPGFPAAYLTDGSPATAWYAAAESAWAYIDLGRDVTFNQIGLRWATPYARRYGIYVWDSARGQWIGNYWSDEGRGGSETASMRPVYGRYVLLYAVQSSDPRGGFAVSELEVYGRDRPNLALGAGVVASSAQDCCPPWHAVDGDLRTGWAALPLASSPWLRLHLPGPTEITELRLHWDAFAYAPSYSLVFYEAGYGRQLIVPSAPSGLNRFEFRPAIAADAILVYAHRVSGAGYVAIGEIELFGPRLSELGLPTLGVGETIGVAGAWPPGLQWRAQEFEVQGSRSAPRH